MSFNDMNEKLKKSGYNRSYRRNLLRDIPKEARDIKLEPELPEGLKLAKGFGIASTALAFITAYEDYKNNDTNLKRREAIGVDVVGAAATYGLSTVAVAVLATLALPEIVAVGAIGYGVSKESSRFKGHKGLK